MGKKRKLSEADQVIWNEVSKSVQPLRPRSPRPEKSLPDFSKQVKSAPVQTEVLDLSSLEIGSLSSVAKDQRSAQKKRTAGNMDRRSFERLVKGKKDIDLTIDLHGMTLDRAQRHLQARLIGAHAAGLRLVLVITGKGNKTTVDEFNRPRAGVLRQNLPDWCSRLPLSSIVLQLVQAQQKHGGGGAFYVYLKRAR